MTQLHDPNRLKKAFKKTENEPTETRTKTTNPKKMRIFLKR